jgi:hypothetical protein
MNSGPLFIAIRTECTFAHGPVVHTVNPVPVNPSFGGFHRGEDPSGEPGAIGMKDPN